MSQFPQCLNSVPPVWELDRYVAVNPFVGHTARPFSEVMQELEARTGHRHLPSDSQVSEEAPVWAPDTAASMAGPFLASYYGSKSALVPAPWAQMDLWTAWKASVPASAGLGWVRSGKLKALVRGLPDQPSAALRVLLAPLNLESAEGSQRILQLLAALPGWAAYLRQVEWPGAPAPDGPLATLAAILAALAVICPTIIQASRPQPYGFAERWAGLEAAEAGLRRQFLERINPAARAQGKPRVRAAFCIDVRSEPFRRAWEQAEPGLATDGFAGFFGIPMAWDSGEGAVPHLPVLLQPAKVLGSGQPKAKKSARATKLATAGAPNFALVEATGWAALGRYLTGSKPKAQHHHYHGLEAAVHALPAADKGAWARFILKNLGWVDNWAPLMLLVGHGSTSLNNPHATGLDCGACGGQTGEASAKAAAALLNDAETRAALADLGINVPADTCFVGALHDTTLDRITFFVEEIDLAVRSQLDQLQFGLEQASATAQAARQQAFPFLAGRAEQRARDEAQTRPETALANNAAFIVAPRAATAGSDLEGRAFLHSYEAAADPDGSVLELILTAPAVVASWINLQYWAATVTPELYGGGDKLLHSRIGQLGVLEGNVYDLKPGLPLQSVSWLGQAYHQPSRLHVLAVAPRARIDAILAKHPAVAALFDGGWMHLLAYEDNTGWQLRQNGRWQPAESKKERV